MKVIEAAHLMSKVYYDKASLNAHESISLRGMEAHLIKDLGILIIEGTNSLEDWFDFNFDVFGKAGTVCGDSGVRYHEGFYQHAMLAYSFAKPFRREIRLVIGHSLGAASAQIVGPSLGKPTIAFASPKPLLRGEPLRAHLVTNFCREDDLICRVPPGILGGAIGFEHIGLVEWLKPTERNIGEDHRINEYIELLEQQRDMGQREIPLTS